MAARLAKIHIVAFDSGLSATPWNVVEMASKIKLRCKSFVRHQFIQCGCLLNPANISVYIGNGIVDILSSMPHRLQLIKLICHFIGGDDLGNTQPLIQILLTMKYIVTAAGDAGDRICGTCSYKAARQAKP